MIITMTIKEALAKLADTLEKAARHYKDKGKLVYSTEDHANSVGFAMRQIFHPKEGEGLESTGANYASVFLAAYNHSAWRQKFERLDIFPKKEAKTFENAVSALEEEFGEE